MQSFSAILFAPSSHGIDLLLYERLLRLPVRGVEVNIDLGVGIGGGQITALLYERRLGAAEVEKARAAAERRMAEALEGDGSELETAEDALAKARAGLEALGATGDDPTLASVLVMEGRLQKIVAERAARAEAEAARRRVAAEAAVALAEEHLAGGLLLEARTAHGLAAAELELAGTLVPQLPLPMPVLPISASPSRGP
jgi:hypothetical protein